jgi:multicomponent Na+:H+ antiporter subunit B
MKKSDPLAVVLMILFAVTVFFGYASLEPRNPPLMMIETLRNHLMHTGVKNVVMTVYLDFRLFDTLFETMLLLVCVIGVVQFSELTPSERNFREHASGGRRTAGFSPLMTEGLQGVYPFVLVFGVYVVLSGVRSPGGGFQGGAIIAAIFMSKHLSTGGRLIPVELAFTLEKILFLSILVLAALFLILRRQLGPGTYLAYMYAINLLIGFKVFCGFVILYMKFMHSGLRRNTAETGGRT